MTGGNRVFRVIVLGLVAGGIGLPIVLGFWEIMRAAFGFLPAIGSNSFSLKAWQHLAGLPGFLTSLRLTLVTGFGSTILALLLAVGISVFLMDRFQAGPGARVLGLILSVPHSGIAIGLAFLIAPSGWLARLISPWATGWNRPPDITTLNDDWGLALILALLIKEVPFILLVIRSALNQIPFRQHLAIGRALGYGIGNIWLKIILPQVYPQIRLTIFVVLAFSLSVVDMAIILGPSNPPTLAVAIMRWFTDPDTLLLLPASAAALVQLGVVAGSIGLWALAEKLVSVSGKWWLRRGSRSQGIETNLKIACSVSIGLMAIGVASLVTLLLWSTAWRWSFPNALPEIWSLELWTDPLNGWGVALANSLVVGLSTILLSLLLAIAWLESEGDHVAASSSSASALVYLPLLVPQISFLYGLNVLFLRSGISEGVPSVIWAHTLFVFPYVLMALSDPWRAFDPRLLRTAASLGYSKVARLFRVKFPILLKPILTAAAIGMAVSVAQYLPTLFMSAGRLTTVTTEAVALSSGSDRRIVGVYSVLQAALPFLSFALAFVIPAILHRNRRYLNGENPS